MLLIVFILLGVIILLMVTYQIFIWLYGTKIRDNSVQHKSQMTLMDRLYTVGAKHYFLTRMKIIVNKIFFKKEQ